MVHAPSVGKKQLLYSACVLSVIRVFVCRIFGFQLNKHAKISKKLTTKVIGSDPPWRHLDVYINDFVFTYFLLLLYWLLYASFPCSLYWNPCDCDIISLVHSILFDFICMDVLGVLPRRSGRESRLVINIYIYVRYNIRNQSGVKKHNNSMS